MAKGMVYINWQQWQRALLMDTKLFNQTGLMDYILKPWAQTERPNQLKLFIEAPENYFTED